MLARLVGAFRAGCVILVLLIITAVTRASTLQPLANPGFESGLSGWLLSRANGGSAVTDSSRAHSGASYALLSGSSQVSLVQATGTAQTYVPVNPGDVVHYGGWALKETGDGVARWVLRVTDSGFGNPQYFSLGTAGGTWTLQQGTYTVPANVRYITLYAEVSKMTALTSARFDDAILLIEQVATSVPATPTAFSGTAASATTINLSWNAASDDQSGFGLEISTDGSNFGPRATLPASATSYSDTGVTAADTFYYRIYAFNQLGKSGFAVSGPINTPALGASWIERPLQNPGFESNVLSWQVIKPGTEAGISDVTLAHSGTGFAKIVSLPYAGLRAAGSDTQPLYIAVRAGDKVRFGGWSYRESGNGLARWALEVTDSAKLNPSYLPLASAPGAAWSYAEQTYTVPTGKSFIRFYCEVNKSTTTSTARFDDALLEITHLQRPNQPTVTSVNPEASPASGGAAIEITGTNFVAGATIEMGGALASDVRLVNNTTLRGITPPHPPAVVDIRVTNPDGRSGTLASGYQFLPVATSADLTKLKHFVVFIQENRSFDSYFGRMGQYRRDRGFNDPFDETPVGTSLITLGGRPVQPYHFRTVCNERLSPGWNSSFFNYNFGKMDNFAKTNIASTIDPDGTRALGYSDWTDLPYYYELAFQYGTSDSFFSSLMSITAANRMYIFSATSFGHKEPDPPPAGGWNQATIFDRLTAAGVSWRYYYQDTIKSLASWKTWGASTSHVFPISQYYTDLQSDATLPSVVFIERAGDTGLDEHPPANIQKGAANSKLIIDALLHSPAWPSSVFIFGFDESDGLYDHVPPPPMVQPDGIIPLLRPGDPNVDFDRAGFRVPFFIVSPWVKPHFVSHVVRDHSAIWKLIETRFGLNPLTRRDAAADDMLEFFDFASAPRLAIPTLPAQPTNGACNFNLEVPPNYY
jgi:phospholipase C